MKEIFKKLGDYTTDAGNSVCGPQVEGSSIHIEFSGKNNRLIINKNAVISYLKVHFDSDNGSIIIGKSSIKVYARIGLSGSIKIGNGVTSTSHVYMTAAEMTTIRIGDGCMFALGNELRADDSHPIFDIHSEQRVNPSEDINIGQHVWLAQHAAVMGGSDISEGSIIGFRSVVMGKIPNNVIAVGSPARVVRRDVAWERPHLSIASPGYKPDASSIKKSSYWKNTME